MNTAIEALQAGRNLITKRGYQFVNWGFHTEGAICPSGAIYLAAGIRHAPWAGDETVTHPVPDHVAEAQWRLAKAFGFRWPLEAWEHISTSVAIRTSIALRGSDYTLPEIIEKFNEAIAACPHEEEARQPELVA